MMLALSISKAVASMMDGREAQMIGGFFAFAAIVNQKYHCVIPKGFYWGSMSGKVV